MMGKKKKKNRPNNFTRKIQVGVSLNHNENTINIPQNTVKINTAIAPEK